MIVIRLNNISNNTYSNNAGNFFGTNIARWNNITKSNTVVSGNNVSNSINILVDDDGLDFTITDKECCNVPKGPYLPFGEKDQLNNTVIDLHDEHYNDSNDQYNQPGSATNSSQGAELGELTSQPNMQIYNGNNEETTSSQNNNEWNNENEEETVSSQPIIEIYDMSGEEDDDNTTGPSNMAMTYDEEDMSGYPLISYNSIDQFNKLQEYNNEEQTEDDDDSLL